jgi:hypothetical protein
MKRFSEIQKRSKIRRINESDEIQANLPSNYEDMSKEELIKLMSGQQNNEESEEEKEETKEVDVEKNVEGGSVKFFSKLFESREMAHVYHLQVKGDMGSHAKHVALQEYYEGDDEGEGGVLESLDGLIEMYQGQFGIIEGYETIDTSSTMSKDPIEYFTELAEYIKTERHNCFDKEDTHYFNLIDDVLVLIYQLLYKLKYTK